MRRIVGNVRLLLLVFVAIGAAAIFVLRPDPTRGQPNYFELSWMVGSVVTLMIVFGWVVWYRERLGIGTETDAEAFYYLGFIYTLVSLIATFLPLLVSGGAPRSQHVLGLFGLGMVTTFLGLAGRILFLQDAAAEDVAGGAARLNKACVEAAFEIEKTVAQISRVGGEMERAIVRSHDAVVVSAGAAAEKALVAVSGAIERSVNRNLELVDSTTKSAIENVRSVAVELSRTLGELQARVSALSLPAPELCKLLEEHIKDLTATIGTVVTSMGALAERGAALGNALQGLAKGTNGAVEGIGALRTIGVDASDGMRQLLESLQAAREEVEDLAGGLTEAGAAYRVAAEAMQPATKAIGKIGAAVVEVSSSLETLAESAARASPAIIALTDGLVTAGAGAGDLGSKVAGIDSILTSIQSGHEGERRHLEEVIKLLEKYRTEADAVTRQLHAAVKESADAVVTVHKNLVEATKFIVSKVE